MSTFVVWYGKYNVYWGILTFFREKPTVTFICTQSPEPTPEPEIELPVYREPSLPTPPPMRKVDPPPLPKAAPPVPPVPQQYTDPVSGHRWQWVAIRTLYLLSQNTMWYLAWRLPKYDRMVVDWTRKSIKIKTSLRVGERFRYIDSKNSVLGCNSIQKKHMETGRQFATRKNYCCKMAGT